MRVKSIRLINFRNYKNLLIDFNSGINILVGKNAQGKTNLLEAIYMTSTGKSFRTNRDKELILHDKTEAYIASELIVSDFDRLTEIKLHTQKPKRIRVNKNELKAFKELNNGLKVIVFFPEDLRLIKDGPTNRRAFLDFSIGQLKPIYKNNLYNYNKVLIQRNNILKNYNIKSDLKDLLEIFELQLARLGALIIIERRQHIEMLQKKALQIHKKLTNNKEDLELKYITNTQSLGSLREIESHLLESYKKNLKRDLEQKTTEIGPHRDDIDVFINGDNARIYASQGQQRTVVLTLKLSELEFLKEDTGEYPILLLDDVYSELDEERKNVLTSLFKQIQTFITTTDLAELNISKELKAQYFKVEDGEIYKENFMEVTKWKSE